MQWRREEYIAHMTFQDVGREMFCEMFGPLVGLEEEWRAQGATGEECSLRAFGWDSVKRADIGCNFGAVTGQTPHVLEDTPAYTLSVDAMGRTQKLIKSSASIPLPLDYPVKSFADWEKIRHWYAFDESRVDRERLFLLKKQQQEGTLITAWIPGGFDEPRQLLGEEAACLACYEQPELIEEILSTISDTALKILDRVTDVLAVDNLCVHEDLAGKTGPLWGPRQVETFIAPYYRKIWNAVSSQGGSLFSQDSDGNIEPVIDAFLDAGVNVMYPFEPGAGMDMVRARQKYQNRLAFKGGLDKYALRAGKEEIRRELTYKMSSFTKGGGTVFALDHRIPNGVPIENYRYYVQLGRELLGLPPAQAADFENMAF